MKVVVLSSGSKGNTTYIESMGTKILIDMGNSLKYVKEKLKNINICFEDIDGIILTHTHKDHIGGLKTAIKRYNPKIYLSDIMLNDLEYVSNYELINNDNINIKDLNIEIIKTSHDASDSRGYIINDDINSIVYITDTGYINKKYYDKLFNKDIYIMESNHDVEMINNSSYPFVLRQRILSAKGHLSNHDCSNYLSKFIGTNTKYIFLAHLSQENNTIDLAYNELKNRLDEKNIDNIDIILAKQNEETKMVEL